MSTLQVTLFGKIHVTWDNWQTEIKLTRGIQAILAYLLLNRHATYPREVMAGLFWGNYSQERAHDCLNTALWRLRSALEPDGVIPGTYLLGIHSNEVGFNSGSPYWLDVAVFEEQATRLMAQSFIDIDETSVQELESILKLYKGDLLDGFYEDWALRERERFRSLYIKSLRYLVQYDKCHHFFERGLLHGQQILDLDPTREEIHREIMRLYMGSGQRAQAIRQYEICRRILEDELGVPPMQDTLLLYTQILSDTGYRSDPFSENDISNLDLARLQLDQAAQAINLANIQIQQAIRSIKKNNQASGRLVIDGDQNRRDENYPLAEYE